jgi:hypothetical protein
MKVFEGFEDHPEHTLGGKWGVALRAGLSGA